MAEGLLRDLAGDRFEALSAGSNPAGYVHAGAVQAMNELGIDISDLRSKSIDEFLPPVGEPPDTIISVCSNAEHDCPTFPGNVERLHWPFDDPAQLSGSDDEKLQASIAIRDQIREKVSAFVQELVTESA